MNHIEPALIGIVAAYELLALNTPLPTITALLLETPRAVRAGVLAAFAYLARHFEVV